jgi:hypothetical protein
MSKVKKSENDSKQAVAPATAPKDDLPLSVSLMTARRVLWKGHPPKILGWFLDPLRIYVIDPVLSIQSVLLPAILPTQIGHISSFGVDMCVPLLKVLYIQKLEDPNDLGAATRGAIVGPSVVAVRPPSDFQSAFQGVISFICSAIGDVAGMMTNPKKYTGWMQSLTQFNTFLRNTGVQAEMEEAIQKPLLCGRLLDNFKILNDIFETHLAGRIEIAQHDSEKARTEGFEDDIRLGHRLMRFATAAYGTEMIRSAVDEDVDASQFLEDGLDSVALHTRIPKEDIKFVYAGNEKDYDKHVLHHFVSIDRENKSIVLGIRGTLSLSGAIADMQGMAAEYCSGKAHRGISEMAKNIWNESGDKVLKLMDEYKDYKLVVTGHSLGGGASCLLTIHLYVDEMVPGDRKVECFAFAPPPTFYPCSDDSDCCEKVNKAIQNTVAYIHDNDVVPFLSVAAIRRLTRLLDAVDNETEHIYFWNRWKIFYEYAPIPEKIIKSVLNEIKTMSGGSLRAVDGEHNMIIPARRVVWCKHDFISKKCDAFSCDPEKIAQGNIFLTSDMISDHMPENYEDALDSIFESISLDALND